MKETDVMKVGAELLAKRADEKRCSIVMRSQIDKSQVKESMLINTGKAIVIGTACLGLYKSTKSSSKRLAILSLSTIASRELMKVFKIYKSEYIPLQNRHF